MKYKDWLDVWFANYIEPSSKTKTCERYSEIKELGVKDGFIHMMITKEDYLGATQKVKVKDFPSVRTQEERK